MKLKLKYLSLLAGASLMFSSCEDFLDRPSQDAVTVENYLVSDENLLTFTYQVYGPFAWDKYEDKFSWCAGELQAGNVYHTYDNEGQFFKLNFSETNALLLDGYTSLYNVISRCNMLISEMPKNVGPKVTKEAVNRAVAEAKMYRGYAYFLLAEYWGETFLILKNTDVIAGNSSPSVQKASREVLYAQIEKDWKEAYEALPATPWGNKGERVTKVAAKGMLAKLYLTMASCQNKLAENNYVCPDPDEYYNKAINAINEAEAGFSAAKKEFASTGDYENIFMTRHHPEVLFALEFESGAYGAGSSRQIQFGRSKYFNQNKDAYGSGKSLAATIFENFDPNDIRKRACCYFTSDDKTGDYDGYDYLFNSGETYQYRICPKNWEDSKYDSDAGAGPVLNHIRKFVYNTPLDDKFSCPMTLPILRVADLYLMRAEAKMALEDKDVTAYTKAGLDDINKVRNRAGLSNLDTLGIAMYAADYLQKRTITDWAGNNDTTVEYYTEKYDLMTERVHEFALECQSWLDVKRLYYRNEDAARGYLKERDRGWYYGEAFNLDGKAKCKKDYMRQRDINAVSKKQDPSKPQPEEEVIDTDKVQWFMPLPSKIQTAGYAAGLYTDVDAVKEGNYPY